jgi:iron(III) transport system permease protein
VTASIFIVYFMLIVVLPFAVLLWSPFQKFYRCRQARAAEPHARPVPLHPHLSELTRSVVNSLLLAFGSATLIMLVTSVICWIVVKTKLRALVLDNIACRWCSRPQRPRDHDLLPELDIALRHDLDRFIAYIRSCPTACATTRPMLQIHKELEESAAMSGAL